jgi:hypothetical protein
MTDSKRNAAPRDTRPFNRRNLLRQAGFLGAGAVGLGMVGCKQRPDDELADPTSPPQVLQQGGTVSARLSGLLNGVAVAGATMRVKGVGSTTGNDEGAIDVRVEQTGTYDVEFSARDHFSRTTRVVVAGNVSIVVTMLESDDGISQSFLNQYARGTGAGKGITIEPRTAGFTNRWTRPPTYRIYRRLADSTKEFVTDARLDAMRGAIFSLFPALTAGRLGIPAVDVRNQVPPEGLGDIGTGVVVVAQTKSTAQRSENTGGISDPYSIVKGRISCGFDSSIELFSRMVAHSTGAYGVNSGGDSIVSGPGRASLSDRDSKAATFLYSRAAGNSSPDRDPDDVILG